MLERANALARLVTLEMGKLIGESREEADLSARVLRYYGEEGPGIAAPRPLATDGAEAVLVTEPVGVLLAVEPWNYPLYQVVRIAGPNLVLGNALLLKHAGNCPQCALAIERLFRDAGVPKGVFTNLFMATEDIPHVIGSPVVHGASLTGSDRADAAVARDAGAGVTKSVLELGGSDPFVVLDGERLERTIAAAAKGRLSNTGQSCVASKRFIVLATVCDAFLAGLRDRFATVRPGDPADPATTSPRWPPSARPRRCASRSRTRSPRAPPWSSAAAAPTAPARSLSRRSSPTSRPTCAPTTRSSS